MSPLLLGSITKLIKLFIIKLVKTNLNRSGILSMEPGTQVSSVDLVDEISDPERAVTKLIDEFALFGLFRD